VLCVLGNLLPVLTAHCGPVRKHGVYADYGAACVDGAVNRYRAA
jgi:hypothetical protein